MEKHLLDQRTEDGARDASLGVFLPPYPCSDDPQDDAENAAYEKGWRTKRSELRDSFRWA